MSCILRCPKKKKRENLSGLEGQKKSNKIYLAVYRNNQTQPPTQYW